MGLSYVERIMEEGWPSQPSRATLAWVVLTAISFGGVYGGPANKHCQQHGRDLLSSDDEFGSWSEQPSSFGFHLAECRTSGGLEIRLT